MNPYHDRKNGEFSSASGGGGASSSKVHSTGGGVTPAHYNKMIGSKAVATKIAKSRFTPYQMSDFNKPLTGSASKNAERIGSARGLTASPAPKRGKGGFTPPAF